MDQSLRRQSVFVSNTATACMPTGAYPCSDNVLSQTTFRSTGSSMMTGNRTRESEAPQYSRQSYAPNVTFRASQQLMTTRMLSFLAMDREVTSTPPSLVKIQSLFPLLRRVCYRQQGRYCQLAERDCPTRRRDRRCHQRLLPVCGWCTAGRQGDVAFHRCAYMFGTTTLLRCLGMQCDGKIWSGWSPSDIAF